MGEANRTKPRGKVNAIKASRPCEHTDEAHCALVNRFIEAMNKAMQDGHCSDFVSSAATAAAASFSVFNHTDHNRAPLPPEAAAVAVDAFRRRFREAVVEHPKPGAPKERRAAILDPRQLKPVAQRTFHAVARGQFPGGSVTLVYSGGQPGLPVTVVAIPSLQHEQALRAARVALEEPNPVALVCPRSDAAEVVEWVRGGSWKADIVLCAIEDAAEGRLPPGVPAVQLVQIGARGRMGEDIAREAAKAVMNISRACPDVEVQAVVEGYDDDPREVPDIPEALEQFRLFGSHLVAFQEETGHQVKLDELSVAFCMIANGVLPRSAVVFEPSDAS